ncbi:hypothetical protein B296_00058645, partial [Ensete ventricosum]
MATGWVKSLHCKSNAVDDVVYPRTPSSSSSSAKKPLLSSVSCGHTSHAVKDVFPFPNSSWSSSSSGAAAAAFPGEIEMLFRVHNPARTVARFEEHRAAVRAGASRSDDARCAADGNEMMRFHCGVGGGVVYDAGVACSVVRSAGKKVVGVRTFAGSGGAHASGGGGAGR